jgi:hypothetical protein
MEKVEDKEEKLMRTPSTGVRRKESEELSVVEEPKEEIKIVKQGFQSVKGMGYMLLNSIT